MTMSAQSPGSGDPVTSCSLDQARSAKQNALSTFSHLVEVIGVGITRHEGGYAVKVNLRAPPADGVSLPSKIDGVPVCIEVTGPLRKRR